MKKTFILIATAITVFSAVAQESPGFYGKKAYLELSGQGGFNLLQGLGNQMIYKGRNGKLAQASNPFSGGFSGTIGIAATREIGISLEVGMRYDLMPAPTSFRVDVADDPSYFDMRHESLSIRTLSIMPILEFGEEYGSLPLGISHQVGFGYTLSRVAEKDYVAQANFDNFSFYDPDQGQYVDYDAQEFLDSVSASPGLIDYDYRYKGYTLMYALKMRSAISRSFMLNYGLRYTLNIVGLNVGGTFNNQAQRYNANEIGQEIRRERLRNFISLNFGVTYVF
jgi:hypothetical protein